MPQHAISPVQTASQPAEQQDILRAVMRVLEDPEFANIFDEHALAETPIAGILAGQPVAGIIDRLLVTDDEVLIVDYKSNRPPPTTAEATPVPYSGTNGGVSGFGGASVSWPNNQGSTSLDGSPKACHSAGQPNHATQFSVDRTNEAGLIR